MSVPVLELEESAVTDSKVDLDDSFALTNFTSERVEKTRLVLSKDSFESFVLVFLRLKGGHKEPERVCSFYADSKNISHTYTRTCKASGRVFHSLHSQGI